MTQSKVGDSLGASRRKPLAGHGSGMLRDAPRDREPWERLVEGKLPEGGGEPEPRIANAGDPLEAVKRKVYLESLAISAPSLPLLWLALRSEDPFINFVFPPMALFCAAIAFMLWRNIASVRMIERVTFAAVSLFAFLHLIHSLSTTSGLAGLRAAAEVTTFPTLVVLYVIAYLIFDTRDGLRASLLLYGASLALVLAGAAATGFADMGGSEISWIAQTYAFMGAVVVLLYATAFAKSELSRERAIAEAMSQLALTDQLTGTSNRRKLYMDLQRGIGSVKRHGRPLSVILFDLDHFKLINDSHGHDRGDDILREVVRTISPLLRTTDHFGRWGGEEFILVAPETNLEQASDLAERLRLAIAEINLEQASEVTASFGIAEYDFDDSPEPLIKRADEALYNAKAAGRNRVESFS